MKTQDKITYLAAMKETDVIKRAEVVITPGVSCEYHYEIEEPVKVATARRRK